MDGKSSNSGFSKNEIVTGILNDFIEWLNKSSTKVTVHGSVLSTRYILGVVKYGGQHEAVNLCKEKYGVPFATAHHLGPLQSKSVKRMRIEGDYQFEDLGNTWFETSDLQMGGWTPMYKGFEMAKELLQIIQDVPRCNTNNSPYPLVFNITDGWPTQFPPEYEAGKDFQGGFDATAAMIEEVSNIVFNPGPILSVL